jgi:hypothetical protein
MRQALSTGHSTVRSSTSMFYYGTSGHFLHSSEDQNLHGHDSTTLAATFALVRSMFLDVSFRGRVYPAGTAIGPQGYLGRQGWHRANGGVPVH